MRDAQFTPGPWEWSENGNCLRPVNPDPERHDVHTICSYMESFGFLGKPNFRTEDQQRHNRRLIAAAPDLAGAISGLLHALDAFADPEEVAKGLGHLLAQAGGALTEAKRTLAKAVEA